MRVLTRANVGGPTAQAIALWHAFAARGVTTLLVTGRVQAGESELSPALHGVPALGLDAALQLGERASGWVELPWLGRGVAPFADRRAMRTLRQLNRAQRPDVVHTHTSKAGWLGRRALHAGNGPLLVHTFHGHVLRDYFPAPIAFALARVERWLARRTDVLVAVSASCADELAAAGVAARERFLVIPPAVAVAPVSRAEARQRLQIHDDVPRVVCLARLVPIKRVEHFVAAVAAVPSMHGDVYGDGPRSASLQIQAAACASGRVRFCGARSDIAPLLAAYDALVLPSVREGFPLAAVEAFAAGVPVVGYDVPGVRDAVLAGGGILVPVAAGPAGLAAAMLRPHRDDTAARAAVQASAPAAVADALLAAYTAALARRYHARPSD